MKPGIVRYLDCVPTLISNTHLEVFLEGWPAAAAIASVCGALVALVPVLVRGGKPSED